MNTKVLWTNAFLFIVNVFVAYKMIILDCDETFNYWEPFKGLLYQNSKSSFWRHALLTWEYAPQYSLRSFAYLLFWIALISPVKIFTKNSYYIYKITRMIIAIASTLCQVKFLQVIRGVEDKGKNCDHHCRISEWLFWIFIMTPAFLTSTSTILPNTLSMNFILLVWAYFLTGDAGKIWRAKFLIILMLITSWPYAITGVIVPLFYLTTEVYGNKDKDNLEDKGEKRKRGEKTVEYTLSFPSWSVKLQIWCYQMATVAILGTIYILLPIMLIERWYYDKWTIPSVNALIYNLLSHDPRRFGTESWSYYPKNLLLNFNIFLPFAAFQKRREIKDSITFTVFASLLMFSIQSHKEERFLYHLYPLIAFLSARGIRNVLEIIKGRNGKLKEKIFKITLLVIGGTFGFLRMSIFFQDLAGIETLIKGREGTICLMDNMWYLSPPSMIASRKTRYNFIKGRNSSTFFDGALPIYNIKKKNVNNLNESIEGQYLMNIGKCDYIVSREEYENSIIEILEDYKKQKMEMKNEIKRGKYEGNMKKCISIMDGMKTTSIRRWIWMPSFPSFNLFYKFYYRQNLCVYYLDLNKNANSKTFFELGQ